MNQLAKRLVRLVPIVALFLGSLVAFLAEHESAFSKSLASAEHPKGCESLFMESVHIPNCAESVDRMCGIADCGFLSTSQLIHRAAQLDLGTRSNGVVSRVDGFIWKGRRNRKRGHTYTAPRNAHISGGLARVLDCNFDSEIPSLIWNSLCAYGEDVSPELPFRCVLHGLNSDSCGVSTLFGDRYSFSHPVRLDKHSYDLTNAHENQRSCEVNDPPFGRMFAVSLIACVGGYGLALWGLSITQRFWRGNLVGIGVGGIVIGFVGWWVAFAFPGTWGRFIGFLCGLGN
jgi:hypothetical protein